MWLRLIKKEDSSPIGLEADKPKPPLNVLSYFAELKPPITSDVLCNLVFETLLTLSV